MPIVTLLGMPTRSSAPGCETPVGMNASSLPSGLITSTPRADPARYGAVEIDARGRMTDVAGLVQRPGVRA